MAISKKQVIESIQAMPEEEFTDVDVLLERIMLLNKIDLSKIFRLGHSNFRTGNASLAIEMHSITVL